MTVLYVSSAEHLDSLDNDVEHDASSSDSEMDIGETYEQFMSKEQERTVSCGRGRGGGSRR